MLLKVSGKPIPNEQMNRVIGQRVNVHIFIENPCVDYCNDHCGTEKSSDKNQTSGQDFYQR